MNKPTSSALLLAAALTSSALAGPLTPPIGPVQSTMKTLTEVEPRIPINAANTPGDADSLYRITQPGSYYLTGNVAVPANKHGIEIATSNVTIDLGGFRLAGASVTALDGITAGGAAHSGVTIRNGVIYNMGVAAVRLGASAAANRSPSGLIENLVVSNNGAGVIAGNGYTLRNVVAEDNDQVGITVYDGCSLEGCIAQNNGGAGIVAGGSASIVNCTAKSNGGSGFATSVRATLASCTADGNSEDGFSVGSASTITTCSAAGNGDDGFTVTGSLIRDCSSQSNSGDGFQLSSGCTLSNSLSRINTGVGVRLTGGAHRVDSNHVVANSGGGVDFASTTNNFIIRNTFTGHAQASLYQNIGSSNYIGEQGSSWQNLVYYQP